VRILSIDGPGALRKGAAANINGRYVLSRSAVPESPACSGPPGHQLETMAKAKFNFSFNFFIDSPAKIDIISSSIQIEKKIVF